MPLLREQVETGPKKSIEFHPISFENHARFLKEVVEAVIPVFGADRVGVRLSPLSGFSISDSNPQAIFGHAAEMLGQYGLAFCMSFKWVKVRSTSLN